MDMQLTRPLTSKHAQWVGITPVECFTLRLLDYFWWFLGYFARRTGGRAFSFQDPLRWNQLPVL